MTIIALLVGFALAVLVVPPSVSRATQKLARQLISRLVAKTQDKTNQNRSNTSTREESS